MYALNRFFTLIKQKNYKIRYGLSFEPGQENLQACDRVRLAMSSNSEAEKCWWTGIFAVPTSFLCSKKNPRNSSLFYRSLRGILIFQNQRPAAIISTGLFCFDSHQTECISITAGLFQTVSDDLMFFLFLWRHQIRDCAFKHLSSEIYGF